MGERELREEDRFVLLVVHGGAIYVSIFGAKGRY